MKRNKCLSVAVCALFVGIICAVPASRAQEASNPILKPRKKAKAETKEEDAKAETIARKMHEPFWKRLDEAMLEQLGTPAYTPPDPNAPTPRRIPPAPFDSPPFPSGDWQIGGSPIIGDPGELAPYPLMQAIYEGPGGEAWKKSKVQIYGWVNFSGNISTSHPSKTSENGNFPLIYDLRPNRMELNQFVLYIERLPDENQTDHIDWGFRISSPLRTRLPLHDFARLVQRSAPEAQQLRRFRHADGLSRSLHSPTFFRG